VAVPRGGSRAPRRTRASRGTSTRSPPVAAPAAPSRSKASYGWGELLWLLSARLQGSS
jgi:hypothetical protein